MYWIVLQNALLDWDYGFIIVIPSQGTYGSPETPPYQGNQGSTLSRRDFVASRQRPN